ncbi:MAG: DEAD/DEAH box helicase [Ardenticatenaceae bacterium]|nr:DEAD/DEAH box helicase [Ardenticatenaceae bacterium]
MLSDSHIQQEVKARIPHTWPLFFARHGRFTPIQQQAIPPILDGHDTLVIAATASGKTEAVIAPLLERNWEAFKQAGLQLLYICPTRALVRDLYQRLQPILDNTSITIGMKTGDVTMAQTMPAILLTTPESTDSLLTRIPKAFTQLQTIVIDEIHLFDNTPRGDHLRCLLLRIERIRHYADPAVMPTQRVALSATVPDPAGVAGRYLHNGVIVQVPGGRAIAAEIRPLYTLAELIDALSQRAAYKSLIFCNSREQVEETAVTLRQQLPHHADIFVHYSNLDATMRRDVEERFAAAATAVCIATTTLELGIDIGSIDDVVLLGAPPDLNTFMQRIGRGSRRLPHTQVLCMPQTPGEWARFEAMLTLAADENHQSSIANRQSTTYGFRPSILIQQIFSLIKQSPTGSIRLADLRHIAPPEMTSANLYKIVSQLTLTDYLQTGRPGEWKPDEKLQDLFDKHDIYSNIGVDTEGITAVDAHTGHIIAHTDRSYNPGTVLLFGGRPMAVVWAGERQFGLKSVPGTPASEVLRFHKSYITIPYQITQTVAHSLNIPSHQFVRLPQKPGFYLFHFWGTVWGELLASVLQTQGITATAINEYCLFTHEPLLQLPPCDTKLWHRSVTNIRDRLVNHLEMGRFHRLLPADIALEAIIQQLNFPQFQTLYQETSIIDQPTIYEQLHWLIQ